MAKAKWDQRNIPDQSGRVVIVTGATSGLGKEAAKVLAKKGATSSIAHRQGNIDFEDIHWEKRDYKTSQAYSDSKITNLYFAYELTRKLQEVPDAPLVTAAHPGWTSTDLQRHSTFFKVLNPIFGQSVEMGTLPTLRAAIDEAAKPGDYFGPRGFIEAKGYPTRVDSNERSKNLDKAKRLWTLSEELTGVQY